MLTGFCISISSPQIGLPPFILPPHSRRDIYGVLQVAGTWRKACYMRSRMSKPSKRILRQWRIQRISGISSRASAWLALWAMALSCRGAYLISVVRECQTAFIFPYSVLVQRYNCRALVSTLREDTDALRQIFCPQWGCIRCLLMGPTL